MITLKIGGMSCQGCVAAVTRAVTAATQTAPLRVDLERGEVTIGDGSDRETAADAIRRAGFTVEG